METTKEELVELIGIADILEVKLKELGLTYDSGYAGAISYTLRRELNKICGKEYLETLRNPKNGNN